jgi:hypothetical protein
MRLTKTEKSLVERIKRSWNREKDKAQPMALETEIQFQIGCRYGRAISLANEIRLSWGPN